MTRLSARAPAKKPPRDSPESCWVGGGALIGGAANTTAAPADIEGTIAQVAALARAGSERGRITGDRDEAAAAVPHIRDGLRKRGITTPLIGDFHYIGHKLLADHPACAEALDKYRINPGNVGFKDKKDRQFSSIVEMALKHGKPVRIGVNWGSLDQALLTKLMDENAAAPVPRPATAVMREAVIQSALLSAAEAERIGLPREKIILSAKLSDVQQLVAAVEGQRQRRRGGLAGCAGEARGSRAGRRVAGDHREQHRPGLLPSAGNRARAERHHLSLIHISEPTRPY